MNLYRHFELTRLADKFRTIFGQLQIAVTVHIFGDHAHQQSLSQDSVQRALVFVTRSSEVLQLIVVITHHFSRLVSVQNIHDVLGFMMLVHLLDRLQR